MDRSKLPRIAAGLLVGLAISLWACAGSAPSPLASPSPTLTRPTALPASAVPAEAASPTPAGTVAAPSGSPAAVLIEPSTDLEESWLPLDAGTYYVDDPFPVRATFTVPDGWEAVTYTTAGSQIDLVIPDAGVGVGLAIVDNLTADPCTTELLDPAVGPSVDDLVTALSGLADFGFEVSPVTQTTIDGFRGKQLTLQAPLSSTCDLRTTTTTTRQNGVGPGEVNEMHVLDVDGVRVVVGVGRGAIDPPAWAQTQITDVVASIQFGK